MSYIRHGHPLQWFNDCSTEYVFGCGDGQIEDYGTGFEHLPSLIEMVGHMVLNETGDFTFATKVVVALAVRSGIKHKLRLTKPHEYDEIEKSRGHDYMYVTQMWSKFFDIVSRHSSFHTDIDELDDFDYLDEFTEEDLFDVEKNMDDIIEEARSAVQGVIDKLDLPCPITIDASFFRWASIDSGEYEFGVDLKFSETFTSETWKEEREIGAVEKAVLDSGVLKPLEKRVGKIEVCCYVPLRLDGISQKEQ